MRYLNLLISFQLMAASILAADDCSSVNIIEFLVYQGDEISYQLRLDEQGLLVVNNMASVSSYKDTGHGKRYESRVDPVIFYSLKDSLLKAKKSIDLQSNWSSVKCEFVLYSFDDVKSRVLFGHLESEKIKLYLSVISLLHGSAVIDVGPFGVTPGDFNGEFDIFEIITKWLDIGVFFIVILLFIYLIRMKSSLTS